MECTRVRERELLCKSLVPYLPTYPSTYERRYSFPTTVKKDGRWENGKGDVLRKLRVCL